MAPQAQELTPARTSRALVPAPRAGDEPVGPLPSAAAPRRPAGPRWLQGAAVVVLATAVAVLAVLILLRLPAAAAWLAVAAAAAVPFLQGRGRLVAATASVSTGALALLGVSGL